jgi:hypothetical protein
LPLGAVEDEQGPSLARLRGEEAAVLGSHIHPRAKASPAREIVFDGVATVLWDFVKRFTQARKLSPSTMDFGASIEAGCFMRSGKYRLSP